MAKDEKNDLGRLSSSFRYFGFNNSAFLTESFGFYIRLVMKMHTLFAVLNPVVVETLELIWQDQSESVQKYGFQGQMVDKSVAIMLVYRFLIYLGDLGICF
jgi:hypothetical protein